MLLAVSLTLLARYGIRITQTASLFCCDLRVLTGKLKMWLNHLLHLLQPEGHSWFWLYEDSNTDRTIDCNTLWLQERGCDLGLCLMYNCPLLFKTLPSDVQNTFFTYL